MTSSHFGPLVSKTAVEFRLYAPSAKRVHLVLGDKREMARNSSGWHTLAVGNTRDGDRYSFLVDDVEVPDPASHFQPDDIAGPSQVVDHTLHQWRTEDWRGRPWHEAVLLECHVGAFTGSGTFRAIEDKLDHLVGTGITALQLMPVNDFPGKRNWGYDGVLWYAPDHTYGTPGDLKRLIDAAHARGLMIFLDVVYNHFGPDGNFLGHYARDFFCDAQTPWGSAINYDNTNARAFVVQNVLHWLDTYRFDGLRFDAVHAMVEPGGLTLLNEISNAAGGLATRTGRHIHLVLENDDNRVSLLYPVAPVPAGRYRAQWNDDYHHAWHVLLTGETHGYYVDYAREPKQSIARMLWQGFTYQGQPSPHRRNQPRGEVSARLSPTAFVNFLQNHDQIGNRALGDRLEWSADARQIEAALAILLLSPMIPMMFMGEEWGSRAPFPFFCDFKGDLADAVRNGRRKEFAEAYETYGNDVPDPLAAETLSAAVLNWSERETSGQARLDRVRSLLRVRKDEVVPYLKSSSFSRASLEGDGDLLAGDWRLDHRTLFLTANLSDRPQLAPTPVQGRRIWGLEQPGKIAPWSVHWFVKDDS